MNFDSIEYRQKIVYVGLSRMTDDRNTIQRAFSFWLKKLSTREFKIGEIVAYMEKYIGLSSGEKKSLYVAMQAAATRHEHELADVPGFLLDDAPAPPPKPAADTASTDSSSATSHKVITEFMLKAIVTYLAKRHGDSFKELIDVIQEEGLEDTSGSIKGAIGIWAADDLGKLELPDEITEKECGELFYTFCSLTTEFIGPVNMDKLVNLAIEDALDLDESSRFDPRKLL